jgi:hypothetical protein
MQYPINLNSETEKLFLCMWDGGIVEIHTMDSFWHQYKVTNVFEGSFVEMFGESITDVFNRLEVDQQDSFDNMSIRRIK